MIEINIFQALIQTTMQEVLQLLTSLKENRDPKGLEANPLIGLLRMVFGRVQTRVILSKCAHKWLYEKKPSIKLNILKTNKIFCKTKINSYAFYLGRNLTKSNS